MSMSRFQQSFRSIQHQQGVALVVVMIFIVALSMLAAYSMNSANLSERLARNKLDLQLAREAAESALRDAETDLQLVTGVQRAGANCARGNQRPLADRLLEFSKTCSNGQCFFLDSYYVSADYSSSTAASNTGEPWWPTVKGGLWNDDLTTKPTALNTNCNFTGAVPYGTYSGRARLPGVSRQPEYLIERIARADFGGSVFRITARGFGRGPSTEVVLQTYFKPPGT